MTGLSLITANIPLLKPFLKMLQSGLIDSSMPKLSGSYQLSTLSRSNKHRQQLSSTGVTSNESKDTQDSRRRFWTRNTPLTNSLMAPYLEFIDDTAENGEQDSDRKARPIWVSPDNYARIESW